jgi:hypothetical protein
MKMTTAGISENRIHDKHIINARLCPECGANMKEEERAYEGDFVFVWYQCQIDGCEGQWLQKYEKERLAS